MNGAIPPFPQYASMAWCSVKEQGQFTFTFTFKSTVVPPYNALQISIYYPNFHFYTVWYPNSIENFDTVT